MRILQRIIDTLQPIHEWHLANEQVHTGPDQQPLAYHTTYGAMRALTKVFTDVLSASTLRRPWHGKLRIEYQPVETCGGVKMDRWDIVDDAALCVCEVDSKERAEALLAILEA